MISIGPQAIGKADAAMAATLDILKALVLRNGFGNICARAGWTVEMVFHEGDSLAVRERAWKVIDLFIETVGAEKLAIWWADGSCCYGQRERESENGKAQAEYAQ
ncbi:hypothetical protein [Delftia sp.]|uniref:hypothetical protein n=1 Tax=Delftia sp. TaxID=1886637 RepID=UPI00259CE8AC|nr:hypothetical protein [Delftia sp.]